MYKTLFQYFKQAAPGIFAVALVFLTISASIAMPIYNRSFYYSHIESLNLEQTTGYSLADIRGAYNEVMDYLTLPGAAFGTGDLPYSPEGQAHFEDCKGLFDLNLAILLVSWLLVLGILLMRQFKEVASLRKVTFWAGIGSITVPVILGGLVALNFDRAVVIFHQIFFPGKTNWQFDPGTDPIIRILPLAYFRDCAILIGASMLAISATLIWLGRPSKWKKTEKKEKK
jgi:integral membrane protein (TIGR01906 family)